MRIAAWPAFENREVNPYNWLLYTALKANQGVEVIEARLLLKKPRRVDILHLHWPESPLNRDVLGFLKGTAFLIYLVFLTKLWGGKVVWTVHNTRPHEGRMPRVFQRALYKFLGWVVDGVIFLSNASRKRAFSEDHMRYVLHKPSAIIPHGHYRDVYPPLLAKSEARNRLGLQGAKAVVLFLGQIRPYKGVDQLLRVFRNLEGEDIRLVVAGRPSSPGDAARLEELRQEDNRITLILRFLPADEVSLFLSAADILVLPYTDITNSGSALLGLSFGVPVLAPRLGSLVELGEWIPELVCLYDPPLSEASLRDALDRFIGCNVSEEVMQRVALLFDWASIAAKTLEFMNSLLGKKE